MSLAQYIPTVPTVIIREDWSTAAHVLADMEASWNIDFGTDHTFAICVWEGPADPDDFARYTVTAGTLTVTEAFDSQPAVGTTVYIMDFYWA
jgi:hypothetical protein